MCRKTCTNKISDKFSVYKEKLKSDLKNVNFVCTTADIWSSSKRSYMGMTVHWINDTFERKSYVLACRRFKGSHSNDKVAEIISDIHFDYDIKISKIVRTITDNGSNMVKAFEVFKTSTLSYENSESDDDILQKTFPNISDNLDDFHLPNHERCVTHTLHLIAAKDVCKLKYANSSITKLHDSAFSKCHALWNLCSRSPKACETFLHTTGKSPTFPCATRWNSFYNCIKDIFQINIINDIEITYLSEYVKCLKPIAEAITNLEGEKDIFYGGLLPELMRIKKIIHFIKTDNLLYCSELAYLIEQAINKRFAKFLDLENFEAKDAILASVSHPFFKLKWVPTGQKEFIKNLFLTEIRKLKYNEQRDTANTSSQEKKYKTSDSYYMFLEDSDSSTSENNCTAMDLESLQYLKDKETDLKSLNAFPFIKFVFIKYNTCLPSSAPVERLFSFGGMIMRPHRRKMGDSLFEQLVVLKSFK